MRKLITFLCFHLLITLSVYAQPSAIISGGTFSPGEIYTANFTTENFSNITRMNFSITWDTQVLEWIDVNGVENSEFANPDFYDTTDAANGVAVLRWTSPTDQGFTLADGEKLFDMRFRVIGTCGDKSSVRIVSTPERILVNKAGTSFNQNIGLNIEDALMGVCKLPLIVSTTTESGQMGDRICMPVIVENFDSIISVQLLVTWDSTVLQFDGVEGINLPDLDDDFFGIEGGRLFMSWFGPIDGTTVADGEQIFTICFKLIGDNGTRSTIDFNQDSEETEIIGINYGDRNLGIVGRNGRISIRSQSGAAIAAPEEEVQPNGTVCIPITVHDFIEIRNMESELSWDVNVLQFISVSSNNALPGLLLDESNTATGTLGIRWQGFTSAGTTLDDGAIIFEICFRAIGTRGQFSDILFSETETIFTNASGQTFKNTEPGRISIPRETIILSATHAEGRSDSKVCIEIQVTNFNNVQQFG
ncbi:MAG: cohesin domain-containing protein, partial [Bacteroidota bacterium]